MKKTIIVILSIIAALIVIIGASKNILLTKALKKAIEYSTGLEANADVNLSILKGSLDIKDLELFNPPEFQDRIMIHIPRIFVKCSISTLLKKPLVLENLQLIVSELNVIKNKNGKFNIQTFKETSAKKGKKTTTNTSKPFKIKIARLKLKIGAVTYKDYTQTPPAIKKLKIDIEKNLENVTDISQLTKTITKEVLLKIAIKGLAQINTRNLNNKVKNMAVKTNFIKSQEGTKKLKNLFKNPF